MYYSELVFQFQEDFYVSKPGRCILKKYDKLLKSFQSSKALDAVLEVRLFNFFVSANLYVVI